MSRQPRPHLGPSEIKAAAAEFIRPDLREAIALQIVAEYRATKLLCDGMFERPELHDVHAKIRRARIEGAMRVAARTSSGVTAESKRNAAKNAFYTRLRTGPFVLTQSAIEFRDDVPRDAIFRTTLASGQLDLFGDDEGDAYSDEDVILGIVVHGRRSRCLLAPDFLMIGFPEADCSGYVTWIDMEEERARAVARVLGGLGGAPPSAEPLWPARPPISPLSPTGEELVEDELPLHFRKGADEQKNKAGGDGGA